MGFPGPTIREVFIDKSVFRGKSVGFSAEKQDRSDIINIELWSDLQNTKMKEGQAWIASATERGKHACLSFRKTVSRQPIRRLSLISPLISSCSDAVPLMQ